MPCKVLWFNISIILNGSSQSSRSQTQSVRHENLSLMMLQNHFFFLIYFVYFILSHTIFIIFHSLSLSVSHPAAAPLSPFLIRWESKHIFYIEKTWIDIGRFRNSAKSKLFNILKIASCLLGDQRVMSKNLKWKHKVIKNFGVGKENSN